MLKRILFLFIPTLCLFSSLKAQVDTSFWFVAPDISSVLGDNPINLHFQTYSLPATVYVRQPANLGGVNATLTIPANTIQVINLTPSLVAVESAPVNTVTNKGIYISSNSNVSAYYSIGSGSNKELISLKGSRAKGTDFYLPIPNSIKTAVSFSNSGGVGFDVVATGTGVTSVIITPRGNLVGPHAKNNPFVVNLNQGETFSSREDLLIDNRPRCAVTGNFNGDAFPDMALVDINRLLMFVFVNNGVGGFDEIGTYTVGTSSTKIITASLNGDANTDLVVVNQNSNNFSVFFGNGNGTFANGVTYSTNVNPQSVTSADINADLANDLVVTNWAGNTISTFTNNGSGIFNLQYNFNVGVAPTDIVSGFFNGDASPDLAVTNWGSNNVSVLLAVAGTGSFLPAANYGVGANPQAMTLGDFNSDGRIDIATANQGANNISILRANATGTPAPGTFLAAQNYASGGGSPYSIVTTTVNGDANLDVIVSNQNGNNVAVLLGSPTGTMAAAVAAVNGVSLNPSCITFADFNNDGQQDYLTTNLNSSNYASLFGNGTATLSPATYTFYGGTTSFASQLAGSTVSSDKNIAVTISGIVRTTPTTCTSYFADQITSSGNIGKDHVIIRGNGSTDIGYILSTVNSTSLTITTGASTVNTLINYGETFSVNIGPGVGMSHIASNNPIYVLHTSGYGCKLSGAQVPSAFCAGSYTSAFTRISADSLNLNIVTRTGFQNTFTLTSDGTNVPVSGASFTSVPGSAGALVAARLYFPTATIPVASHNVLRNNNDIFGLGVINGGTAGGSAYAYASEFGQNAFVVANPVPSATICSNTTFTLNGFIGGGPITGIWSSNGIGTLSAPPTQYTNNIYTPNNLDTLTQPLTFTLTSTGICPNVSSTFSLLVKQAPIVNAGIDQTICSNNATVQLGGIILGPTNQGIWNVAPPGNGTFTPNNTILNPIYNASNTDTTLNLLTFVLTSTNNAGCAPVTDVVNVFMNKAPLVKSSITNPIIKCKNNPDVFLNGTIGGTVTSTGQWTTTGTGFFNPSNLSLVTNYIPTIADIATGSVSLKLTSTNNQQCKSVSDSVLVLFTEAPTVNVGTDLNSCKNNPVFTLSATIGGTVTNTGIWFGGTGTYSNSNTDLNPTYTASPAEVAAGFVVLTFSTTGNGICAGVFDQLRIDFRNKPIANFSVNTVCLNQNTIYTDLSINTEQLATLSNWNWTLGDGATSTSVNPVYTFTNPGSYTTQLIVTNSYGCADTVYKPVTVHALPNASLSISRACNGSDQLISFKDESSILPPAVIPNPGGYYWDFGGFGFSNAKDTSITFPSQGIYNITHIVTSGDGCKSTFSQSVNITPKPLAQFNIINNSVASLETNVQFIDSSRAATSWFWDFGNGSTSTSSNPATTYTANGTYTVTLMITDQFGCTNTTSKLVKVNNIVSELAQLIPNIVSPNNDGKNDVWRLDFISVFYPEAQIEIYNRWGELIYRSVGYENAWDGSYRGNPLPVGAYFYTINLNSPKDTNIYKGSITLLK